LVSATIVDGAVTGGSAQTAGGTTVASTPGDDVRVITAFSPAATTVDRPISPT
jgi:hypothetical protein